MTDSQASSCGASGGSAELVAPIHHSEANVIASQGVGYLYEPGDIVMLEDSHTDDEFYVVAVVDPMDIENQNFLETPNEILDSYLKKEPDSVVPPEVL